jgi:N6-adenosine-specific RNA methylase IME4
LFVDPPRDYGKKSTLSGKPPYSTLSLNELAKIPLDFITKKDSLIMIWFTVNHIKYIQVLEKAWNIKFVSILLIWIKTENNMIVKKVNGKYSRIVSEVK